MKHYFFTKMPFTIVILAWMTILPLMAMAFEPDSPTLTVTGGTTFDAEINESANSKGKVEDICSGISLTVPVKLDGQSSMELTLKAEQTAYDWTEPGDIIFSSGHDPWDNLYSAELGLNYSHHWNQSWSGLAGVVLGAEWEEDMEDSFSYGGYMGFMYRTDFNLCWIVGVSFFQKPEETFFFPIFGAAWNQGEPGESRAGWSASLGIPETEIRYSFNEIFDIYCNVEMDIDVYRLKDDSEVSPSGLVEMSGFTGGLFLDIRPMKPLSISLGVMHRFEREWEIQNNNGDTVQNVDIEGVAATQVILSWMF